MVVAIKFMIPAFLGIAKLTTVVNAFAIAFSRMSLKVIVGSTSMTSAFAVMAAFMKKTLLAVFSPLILKIAAITLAIAGLAAVGYYLYDNWSAVTVFMENLWNSLKVTAVKSIQAILKAFDKLFGALGISAFAS
jgi:phage-related minor tail protein